MDTFWTLISKFSLQSLALLIAAGVGSYVTVQFLDKELRYSGLTINDCCTTGDCDKLRDELRRAAKGLIGKQVHYAKQECTANDILLKDSQASHYYREAHILRDEFRERLPEQAWGDQKTFEKAKEAMEAGNIREGCDLYAQAFSDIL